MPVPKKKYRDKVRERLLLVHTLLLSDPERFEKLMLRIGIFEKGSDFHNKFEAIKLLLEKDVPVLLAALDAVAEAIHPKSTE